MKSLTKFKIVEIEEISYIDKPQNVYDITVEDNESYTANSYIVHNCTTSANASVHYPMASLIYECNQIRNANAHKSKIVADGGFKNFADIIKGLALGCFLPYAEVITNKGKKKISNVNKGDFVLTHKNRFKQVINIFEYENSKEIVEINGIPSTSNHHYYVIKRIYGEIVNESNIHEYAQWIAAEDLNNDYLLIDLTNQHLM